MIKNAQYIIYQHLRTIIINDQNQVIAGSTHTSSTRGTWWRCWWISSKGLRHETMELVTSMEPVIAKHPIISCTFGKKTATTVHSIPLVWDGKKTIFVEGPWASPDAVVTGSCKRMCVFTMHSRGCVVAFLVAIDHLLGFRISLQTSEIIIPPNCSSTKLEKETQLPKIPKERIHLSS